MTFIVILLLPSFLTLITLLVHRVRASRAARRDRAPEDIVKNLPWRVWNGTRWEKADGTPHASAPKKTGDVIDPASNNLSISVSNEGDEELDRVEQGSSRIHLPWYTTQGECAICLEEFAVGDKVRVLPCEHVFHMNEIDDWLINRKKLVSTILLSCLCPLPRPACSYDSTANALNRFLVSCVQIGCYERSSRLSTIANERSSFEFFFRSGRGRVWTPVPAPGDHSVVTIIELIRCFS